MATSSTLQPASAATHHVKDLGLAAQGRNRSEWAERSMQVLRQVKTRFAKEKPLAGLKVSACLHVIRRDRESDGDAQGGRRRRRALRLEPALHAG
jgi:3-hydroxyisobutyrate dehydrogenase-like beta-hydroxyacid dehydrogenase